MLDRDAIDGVRGAIGAYFRAAGALAEASLLIQLAALGHAEESEEGESERAFLLDRAETYRDKAAHMSRSGGVLLQHATDWINRLESVDGDERMSQALAAFAEAIDDAARSYASVVEALTATPLPEHAAYAELVDELRHAVRFLHAEAASFREIADDH